jgi:hypothetical protein
MRKRDVNLVAETFTEFAQASPPPPRLRKRRLQRGRMRGERIAANPRKSSRSGRSVGSGTCLAIIVLRAGGTRENALCAAMRSTVILPASHHATVVR